MARHEHSTNAKSSGSPQPSFQQLKPLFIIAALIALVSLVSAYWYGVFLWWVFIENFMAGFFLVFSGFKMLDLPGFVDGYSMYDLLAKRVPAYGYVYAFLELGIGLAYAGGYGSDIVHIVVLVLMTFSAIGVFVAMRKKLDLRCACLGTFIKVPLTYVTLTEDALMAVMAVLMLVL